jgi:hypothetical protein
MRDSVRRTTTTTTTTMMQATMTTIRTSRDSPFLMLNWLPCFRQPRPYGRARHQLTRYAPEFCSKSTPPPCSDTSSLFCFRVISAWSSQPTGGLLRMIFSAGEAGRTVFSSARRMCAQKRGACSFPRRICAHCSTRLGVTTAITRE